MRHQAGTDVAQRAALSRLFSPGLFRELASAGKSPLFARLIVQAGVKRGAARSKVADAFDHAFEMLQNSGSRDEYVYRAALTRNVLLGTHSLNTASMLTEFRVGACKADLAILNGTATVYEIKSERDSLSRLSKQIDNYQRVFAKIYVIAAESHANQVLEMTSDFVGVMCLNSRGRITKLRTAHDRASEVCPVTILDSLRLDEARSVLKTLGVHFPDVPNTKIRSVLKEMFATLNPQDVHAAMVKTLKRSRSLQSLRALIDQLPASLHPAALSISVPVAEHERLVQAMRTPLKEALSWV